MLGSCCARAKEAPAHSAVIRTARRALPVELGMDRYNHRNATLTLLTRIVNMHILTAPRPAAGERRAETCTGTVERGHLPFRPRNHIVSQQINIRVAIQYRAVRAIGKLGAV